LTSLPIKRFLLAIVSCLCLTAFSFAADTNPILPQSFAGWTLVGKPQITANPVQADAAYPAVLKEYGFADTETATYTREDGRKLTIKAARFNDATGAYGAFTFYRQPVMKKEEIGTNAASANDRILFFRSNVLIDASFDRLTAMSAEELRELAGMLPAAKGSADNLPNLSQYLPKKGAVENSEKYVVGPQALLAIKGPLTAEQVDFSHDPEILVKDYSSEDGPLTLTLINYPTPQIAGDRVRALEASQQTGSNAWIARRTGPIVDVVTGATGSSEARKLLNSVNYEAEVTWNEATSVSKRDNIGNLIVGVFALIGIILLISLIFGVFFGGIRLVMKRAFPKRVFDRPEDVEIIQLHLRE
jgi:hypothetical protein